MRAGLVAAMITFLATTALAAAEEKALVAEFPKRITPLTAGTLFCNATLGTVLQGRSEDYALVAAGVTKPGIIAKAFEATDRVVVEIFEDKVYLFQRDEFESGKSSRDFPLAIIENSAANLVAIATGLVPPKGATVLTLNRKTGIASWTSTMSVGVLTDSPRIEAIYLTCGARRN